MVLETNEAYLAYLQVEGLMEENKKHYEKARDVINFNDVRLYL